MSDTSPHPKRGRQAGSAPSRGGHRLAAALVAVTMLHGLAVGYLLYQRGGDDGMRFGTLPLSSVLAIPRSTGIAAAGLPGAAGGGSGPVAPARPGRPGPTPLPAETAPDPVGLSIPAIGVNESTLVRLGRLPDGSLEVPTDFARAGWFTGAPTPGTPGTAVIAGHVDSKANGPAVFFRLRDLRPGDSVTVRLSDGGTAQFVVDGVQQYPKDSFPTEAVYGPVPGAALRLITCGGSYDRAASSYRDNIVVYASERAPAS